MAWISSTGEATVGQIVVETADIALGQAIPVAYARPAVGPIREFGAEPKLQATGCRAQVGEAGHARPLGLRFSPCRWHRYR